ncbi:MAG: CoA-binding protein [Anaerolineae bacterium]
MPTMNEAVQDFLNRERIAVVGVSRTKEGAAGANYRKLKGAGYRVFPVNPHAESFDGDPCYPDLRAIPGGVEGVLIVTRPQVTDELVRQCAELGISRVWMHQSFQRAGSSVSEQAVAFCRQNNIAAIPGGCPMMFCRPDFGHTCMRWMLNLMGQLPKQV